jgi:hypothetical protein
MTTYHTALETDGVPAPSDFEFVTAVSPSITVQVVLSFNEYIRYRTSIGRPVNGSREAFWAYLPDIGQRENWTLDCWWKWWDRFVQSQDARDLQNTQQDALI